MKSPRFFFVFDLDVLRTMMNTRKVTPYGCDLGSILHELTDMDGKKSQPQT